MLILVLIDVQYIQNVVFSFKKGSIGKNHSSSDSHHPIIHTPSKICVFSHGYELFRTGSCSFELIVGELGDGGQFWVGVCGWFQVVSDGFLFQQLRFSITNTKRSYFVNQIPSKYEISYPWLRQLTTEIYKSLTDLILEFIRFLQSKNYHITYVMDIS